MATPYLSGPFRQSNRAACSRAALFIEYDEDAGFVVDLKNNAWMVHVLRRSRVPVGRDIATVNERIQRVAMQHGVRVPPATAAAFRAQADALLCRSGRCLFLVVLDDDYELAMERLVHRAVR